MESLTGKNGGDWNLIERLTPAMVFGYKAFKSCEKNSIFRKTNPCHGPAKDALTTSKLGQPAPWNLAMRIILSVWICVDFLPVIWQCQEKSWNNQRGKVALIIHLKDDIADEERAEDPADL